MRSSREARCAPAERGATRAPARPRHARHAPRRVAAYRPINPRISHSWGPKLTSRERPSRAPPHGTRTSPTFHFSPLRNACTPILRAESVVSLNHRDEPSQVGTGLWRTRTIIREIYNTGLMRPPTPLPADLTHRIFSTRQAQALGVSPKRLRGSDLARPFPGVRVHSAHQLSFVERCRALQI